MEFNPRTDIKGDYNVKARGVSSLVMKEIRMQALNQLTTTMTPEDWVYLERRDFLVERLKAHDINIPVKTEEEAAKIRENIANSEMQQLMIEQLKAEIAYKKAQTMGQLTKAKEHNVEAEKKAQEGPESGEDPRIADAEVAKKQTEADRERQKMALEAEKHQLELEKKGQEMRHSETEHGVSLLHQHEKHQKELETKEKVTEHGMKMKEKVATIKAKQKPKKPAKKE
jgi:hypothetical protein